MSVFAPGTVAAVGWTLIHFLWQGAAAALVLAAVNAFLRRSPEARYQAAAATLLAMLALPLGTFALTAPAIERGASGFAGDRTLAMPAATGSFEDSRQVGFEAQVAPALPWLVAGWCLGVAVLSVHSLGGWLLAQRIKRSGLRSAAEDLERAVERLCGELAVSRPVRLCVSVLVDVPTVIGWLRPVVLLPAGALVGLSAAQLELVLAHELAHVRRYDYLVNLMQTAVETLLFYHPAVWWVSNRMRVEREHCCDDLAVGACGSALRYAQALTQLEDLRVSAPRLALAATGGSLAARVRRLLAGPAHAPRSPRWTAGLAGLLAIGLLAALATLQPLVRTAAANRVGDDPQASPSPAARERSARRARPARAAAAASQQQPPQSAQAAQPDERVLPVQAVIELARAGVSPEYLDEMDAMGYRSLSWEQLAALRSHGVGPDYIRGLAAEGFKGLDAGQLIALRSQGVGPDYVHALKAAGLTDLSLSDLLTLRSQGVSPEFAAEMKNVGGDGEPSVSRLVALRSQGVGPDYVRELQELGYPGLSAGRLLALRSQGVSADYVRGLATLGYRSLSIPVLIALRSNGVTPEFARELQQLGYRDLAPGMLVALRSQGVTPEYVRQIQEAGFGRPSPEELIELRSQGVQPDLLKRLKARRQPGEEQR